MKFGTFHKFVDFTDKFRPDSVTRNPIGSDRFRHRFGRPGYITVISIEYSNILNEFENNLNVYSRLMNNPKLFSV